jgi:hypothetical protein
MKYWVQFLQVAVWPPHSDKLIDATGDRSVFVLDGRNTEYTMHQDALKQAQRMEHWRKYEAYQLVCGPRLFEESKRGTVVKLSYPINV